MSEQKFKISESLKAYYSDKAVNEAINELVEKLGNPKKTPEMSWKEARQYNQALLMAAQVRADFAEMLFAIWEATFGEYADEGKLGKEKLIDKNDFRNISPQDIWSHGWIELDFESKREPENSSNGFLVSAEDDKLEIQFYQYENDEEKSVVEDGTTGELASWEQKIDKEEPEYKYLQIKHSVSIAAFFADTDQAIEEWKKAAADLLKVIK
ncbi:MAG: hypothetical protein COA60_001620 [Robiginitomaculum sp.]|nr:hypothetical protein [Robiginitomaculum sp.]